MNVSTLNAGGLDDQVFAGRSLLASSHRETVEAEVSRTLRPHRLAVLGRGKTLATRMDHLPLGRFSLVRLRYGAPVDVDPGRLDTCYLVSLPTAGHAAFHGGDQFVDTGPGQAGVVSPSAAFRTRMDGQFSQIIFRFERERVEACCAALLGRPVERPIEFALSLPLASQAGQLFSHLRHATLLQAACATPALLAGRASVQLFAGLENAMLQALLMFQPSTVHEALHAVHAVPQRAPVRRAIDFIDAQLQQPLTVTDLALHAGVSVRALQLGFQQELGVSPMTFVMQRRLERIRTELQQPHPHTTVTGTAHDWAMPHLGEFAKRYRARFGEAPSMTLRRSRGG